MGRQPPTMTRAITEQEAVLRHYEKRLRELETSRYKFLGVDSGPWKGCAIDVRAIIERARYAEMKPGRSLT